MLSERQKPSGRAAQRLETRERVFKAALAEFRRSGMSGADIGAIVAAADVARGTFYFHFPAKEHVLAELEKREEARIAAAFARFLAEPHDVTAALNELVRLVVAMERRLGRLLFPELLSLHFYPARADLRPEADRWTEYPLIVLLVDEINRGREHGEIRAEADAVHTARFFMLGLYALLITGDNHAKSARSGMLDMFVTTVLRGVEAR